jgi:transposase-like protein
VPVQTAAGAVVSHGGPGISVRGRFLHVAQRDPGVQRGGDERVPQRVRPEHAEIKRLKRENAELRRANEILKAASAFFAAELDRPQAG